MKVTGIYLIINIVNNHRYVGSSKNIERRQYEHFNDLLKGKHNNHYLQNAYNKYGKLALKFEILEECEQSNLLEREQFYIDTLKPEYNIAKYADAPTRGMEHSEETRAKIRNARKGVPHPYKRSPCSEETKKKISESRKIYLENGGTYSKPPSNTGKHRSEETKKKIGLSKINKPRKESTKKSLSEWRKQYYANGGKHPMKDRRHTEESIRKMSEARKLYFKKKRDGA